MASASLYAATTALLTLGVITASARAQNFAPTSAQSRASLPPPIVTLSLRDLLDSAHSFSPTSAAAQARARAARGDRTTAGVFANPMVMYQIENTPFPGASLLVGMSAEQMTTATFPLTPLYQRGARVAQADALMHAAESDARATRQRVLLESAQAFYRAALAEVAVDAADNVAAWLDSVVVYNRLRVEQGATAEAELIRSELEHDRALADAAMRAAELARAHAGLTVFLGPNARRGLVRMALIDAPFAMPTGSGNMASVISDSMLARSSGMAIERRADIDAAHQRVTAADAASLLERRMVLRDFGALIGVKNTGGSNSMVAGMTFPLPLFDQNRGARTRTQAEREAVGLDLLAQQRNAYAELLGADDAARILTQRATILTRRDSIHTGVAYLARADETRTIALGAYREGAATLLQVLDAARAWSDARLAFYQTLFAQQEAVLQLLVARGDDLRATLPTVAPEATRTTSPN